MGNKMYNPDYVQNIFNRMGIAYERLNTIFSFGFSSKWRNDLLSKIPATDEKIEIIDLMSGTGAVWKEVSRKFPNANLTALDFSEEMIRCAVNKNKTDFQDKINIIQQDVLNNTLPDNHYDIVICAFGLKTFSSVQLSGFMDEVNRILKQNGQFIFVEVTLPKNILLKVCYRTYLKQILPFVGSYLTKKHDGHKLLWQYVDAFQKENKLAVFHTYTGNITVNSTVLSYGCATYIHGTKH